jgi:hypothetical protein
MAAAACWLVVAVVAVATVAVDATLVQNSDVLKELGLQIDTEGRKRGHLTPAYIKWF